MSTQLIKKASLIEVDGRTMTSDARYHVNLLADFVIGQFARNQEKWISLKDAANVMFHSGVTSNQDKINRKLHLLFEELKSRGYALVVEPTTKMFKIYSGADSERQYMRRKREFWGDRRDSSHEKEAFISETLLQE